MKYHIFIGSTLDDLKSERKELPRIVMELGHTPVMADYLDGDARNAPKLHQKTIEECDYFIALVAHRYADADGDVSPLLNECSIAAKKGIPILALIIDDKARWKPAKKESDEALVRKLDDFKARLRGGPWETWINTPDLCQKAQTLLVQELSLHARPGWVRADKIIDPTVANEISRLSNENDDLRRQIRNDDKASFAKLLDEQDHALKLLAMNKATLSFYYASGDNWENTRQFRYIRIFKILVPELVLGKNTAEISRFLGTVLNPDLDKTVRKDYPTPSNSIKNIMTDFSVLKLVKCTDSGDGKADSEVWEVTEYGKELYSAYRVRQLEKVLVRESEAAEDSENSEDAEN
ncbi:MAG: DUF4062 domain-containing protein [Treponema sp.]|nr:DUF4062 domain-containing protein [Treponema sp.]